MSKDVHRLLVLPFAEIIVYKLLGQINSYSTKQQVFLRFCSYDELQSTVSSDSYPTTQRSLLFLYNAQTSPQTQTLIQ